MQSGLKMTLRRALLLAGSGCTGLTLALGGPHEHRP